MIAEVRRHGGTHDYALARPRESAHQSLRSNGARRMPTVRSSRSRPGRLIKKRMSTNGQGNVRVGCAGRVYRDWRGPCIPQRSRNADGSPTTRLSSTRSRSTQPSTGCRRLGPALVPNLVQLPPRLADHTWILTYSLDVTLATSRRAAVRDARLRPRWPCPAAGARARGTR